MQDVLGLFYFFVLRQVFFITVSHKWKQNLYVLIRLLGIKYNVYLCILHCII